MIWTGLQPVESWLIIHKLTCLTPADVWTSMCEVSFLFFQPVNLTRVIVRSSQRFKNMQMCFKAVSTTSYFTWTCKTACPESFLLAEHSLYGFT